MTLVETLLPRFLTESDVASLVLLFSCLFGTTWLVEHSSDRYPSTGRLMAFYRRKWMHEAPFRSNRVIDSQLLIALRNGAAFFASGTMIAIGGIAALLGQTERLVNVAQDFSADLSGHEVDWEAKLLFLLLLMVTAFLKFVWSHRLFGYCAILMGTISEEGSEESMMEAAERAALLNISAGRSFNRGLRTTYFTLAALAWFLGPLALAIASLLTVAMLLRREFYSVSRAALLKGWEP